MSINKEHLIGLIMASREGNEEVCQAIINEADHIALLGALVGMLLGTFDALEEAGLGNPLDEMLQKLALS